MRVICISTKWATMLGDTEVDYPKFGQVYTVVGEETAFGTEFYELAEYGCEHKFEKKQFEPADKTDSAVDEVNHILETSFKIVL